jgi:acetolactate synthase regulatory subunit
MMQHHTLKIQLRCCEGAVLRALGLMERRGYRLESCTVSEAQGDGQAMHVCVASERPSELLRKQLERLHDVLWVEISQPAVTLTGRRGMQTQSGA